MFRSCQLSEIKWEGGMLERGYTVLLLTHFSKILTNYSLHMMRHFQHRAAFDQEPVHSAHACSHHNCSWSGPEEV